ncbi:MAG TPA: VOC family protein [Bryobacteraceae bacterium]|nr:VOC family protein [Bryobacteraceae bacterium]
MAYRPSGFHSVTPYLIVKGARTLIEFLKTAFEAEEISVHSTPDGSSIMHAQIRIGDSMLELSDGSGQWQPMTSALHLYVEDVDATYKRAVDAGARSLRSPTLEFYGDRACEIVDPAGNYWFLATHVEDVTDEELAKRMSKMKK